MANQGTRTPAPLGWSGCPAQLAGGRKNAFRLTQTLTPMRRRFYALPSPLSRRCSSLAAASLVVAALLSPPLVAAVRATSPRRRTSLRDADRLLDGGSSSLVNAAPSSRRRCSSSRRSSRRHHSFGYHHSSLAALPSSTPLLSSMPHLLYIIPLLSSTPLLSSMPRLLAAATSSDRPASPPAPLVPLHMYTCFSSVCRGTVCVRRWENDVNVLLCA